MIEVVDLTDCTRHAETAGEATTSLLWYFVESQWEDGVTLSLVQLADTDREKYARLNDFCDLVQHSIDHRLASGGQELTISTWCRPEGLLAELVIEGGFHIKPVCWPIRMFIQASVGSVTIGEESKQVIWTPSS